MTHGPLLGKIVRFAIPLAISGILQLLFNAADIIVVGQFVGPQALAAVGSTSALINLIVNLFIGLSVGANVLVAQYYGASDTKALRETVHTSVLASLIFGCIVLVIGITLAAPMLELMGTPEEVLDQACLYMRIYFIGMPASMLYNFGAAILRAVGDTQRPLYFLFIAGIVNVLLNLFCVIVLHMGVEGVAIPTVISQCVSAGLVLLCLVKAHAPYHVDLHALRLKKDKLLGMVKIGLPAGIQGCSFSISNVLIQSSINSFGALAMAGNTAASNIEGFVSTAQDAFSQAALSFTGQNVGAGQTKRVNRILPLCAALVLGGGLILFLIKAIDGSLFTSADPWYWILWESLFNATARTAGFNISDMALNSVPYALFLGALMFIGGNPGSTTGGVHTTAFAVSCGEVARILQGKQDVVMHKRRIARSVVERAVITVILAGAWVGMMTTVMCFAEPGLSLERLFFEVVSSFATVGFSWNVTPELSDAGKWIIVFNMIVGRVGMVAFVLAFMKQPSKSPLRYPETRLPLS